MLDLSSLSHEKMAAFNLVNYFVPQALEAGKVFRRIIPGFEYAIYFQRVEHQIEVLRVLHRMTPPQV